MLAFIMRLMAPLFLALALIGASAQTMPDSSSTATTAPMQRTNCPNIPFPWYAPGTVPAGFYKSATTGDCLAIPACPGNQTFSIGAESCNCAAGTTWDVTLSWCHAPCAGGTAWNGSSCSSVCGPGTSWTGSSCASSCPAGQTWNGTSCVSMCPAGSTWNGTSCAGICAAGTAWNGASCVSSCPVGEAWSGTSCTSVCAAGTSWDGAKCSSVCGSAETWDGSRCASLCPSGQSWDGSTCVDGCSGGQAWDGASCSCPAGTNWTGSSCVNCTPGTAWNGATCASLCSGSQSWNGSSCACSAGQIWNGNACGTAPVIGRFLVGPATVTIGSRIEVAWTSTGAASLSMNCTGASPAAFSLLPPTDGTGSFFAEGNGSTSCVATATNAWGSTSVISSPVEAVCPGGAAWNGASCVCPAGRTWDPVTQSCSSKNETPSCPTSSPYTLEVAVFPPLEDGVMRMQMVDVFSLGEAEATCEYVSQELSNNQIRQWEARGGSRSCNLRASSCPPAPKGYKWTESKTESEYDAYANDRYFSTDYYCPGGSFRLDWGQGWDTWNGTELAKQEAAGGKCHCNSSVVDQSRVTTSGGGGYANRETSWCRAYY